MVGVSDLLFCIFFNFVINIHHSILESFQLETTNPKKSPDRPLRYYFNLKELQSNGQANIEAKTKVPVSKKPSS